MKAAMATAAKKLYPHVVQDEDVCSGRPCIEGTRIRVMDVVAETRRGRTPEQIVEAFDTITTIDVYAALVYYHDHRQTIDADLDADARLSEKAEREEDLRLGRR